MKFERWTIANRRRDDKKTIMDDLETPFCIVKNTWRYWAADPHLVEHNGHTYLFAELYDRILRRGVIGCCELSDIGTTPWRVILRMPYHLSYPHIIETKCGYFMIPESYVENEIAVYRAVRFPEQWEKVAVLKDKFCAVDSTIFEADGKKWMLTLRFLEERERLMLFPVDENGVHSEGFCITENDPNKRPAGNFFTAGGKLIRPAQDCTESYGCALNFYEVALVSETDYQETLIAKIKPTDLSTDLGETPVGLHTYNYNANYEVIDLKTYEIDWLFYLLRPVWYIWRRVKKIFKR